MQIDKDQGLVKLTSQRLIFAGAIETSEWQFSKMLSVAMTEERNDFLIGVSNRKKTSGLRFSSSDAKFFARIFAMALYSFENGIPSTIKTIQKEVKELANEKPMLAIEAKPKN
jgi:myo-inositol-1-phosphate synthase